MIALKTRLTKLEASMLNDADPMRIANFIVTPGNLDPIGYECNGVKIVREPGEPRESLIKRCFDAVSWPDGCRNIFSPI